MKSFVLDCSVTMAWCFSDEANECSDEALRLLKNSKAVVPSVWSLEVINVLRTCERKNRINTAQSNTFIQLLNALPIEIDVNQNELPNKNILEISRKYSISAYHAAYLELSLRRNIPLISFDKILCEAAEKAGISLQ